MNYAIRKISNGIFSILNLTTNHVVGTYKNNVDFHFERNKSKEYITLYRANGHTKETLYVIDLKDLMRVENVVNNSVECKDLSNTKNKIIAISNFFKKVYDMSYNKNVTPSDTQAQRPMALSMSRNVGNERVYIPGNIKIDNNKQQLENINITDDMVLIKTSDSVKTLSFSDLINVLISVDSKGKTIWDLGSTEEVDESSYGTNPNWVEK